MRRLRWLFNYWRYANSCYPSWRVVYLDGGGRSVPLRRDDARARACLLGPARVEYCRDHRGDLLP